LRNLLQVSEQAPLPAHESERLASLQRMNLLDTPAESRYDRLTQQAREAVGARFSMLTLIDKERQWFKSVQGMVVQETPRAIAFCAHTILSQKHCVVEDTRSDERFCNNPFVKSEPGIRFYAGIPIHNAEGHTIGSFCVADTEAHHLSEADLEHLSRLAADVEQELQRPTEQLAGSGTLDGEAHCYNRTGLRALLQAGSYPAALVLELAGREELVRTFGAEAAALLVKESIGCCRQGLRPQDEIGRLKGDRFVVLSHCPPSHLGAYGADLRRQLQEMPSLHRNLRLKPQVGWTHQAADPLKWADDYRF
jgi:GAF domain-containing protein